MTDRIFWLRVAYWTGAIVDALALIPMLNTRAFVIFNNVSNFHPGWDFRYAMAFGAALMAGWTVLLVWADRKPLERRGVLPITVFPVIVGLNGARYLLYAGGYVAEPYPLVSLILPSVLTVLFLFAYWNSFRGQRAASAG